MNIQLLSPSELATALKRIPHENRMLEEQLLLEAIEGKREEDRGTENWTSVGKAAQAIVDKLTPPQANDTTEGKE